MPEPNLMTQESAGWSLTGSNQMEIGESRSQSLTLTLGSSSSQPLSLGGELILYTNMSNYIVQGTNYYQQQSFTQTQTATNLIYSGWVNQQYQTLTDSTWSIWIRQQPIFTPPTPEQREAMDRQLAAQADIDRRWKEEVAEAMRKAEELLLLCCTEEQKREYRSLRQISVRGEKTGQLYIVRPHQRVLGEKHSFCIHPTERGYPPGDTMLCQKLMLEDNETEFLRVANKWAREAA